MKTPKLVIALASIALLASCGGNNTPSTTTESSQPEATSSAAAKTMAFLADGKYYASVPDDVLEKVDDVKPSFRVNDAGLEGTRIGNIGDRITLAVRGAVAKDIYVTVAKSEKEGHISARAYGPIVKDQLNEGLGLIAEAIGKPNKVFICFSTKKATWDRVGDAEMDQEIQAAWDLVA